MLNIDSRFPGDLKLSCLEGTVGFDTSPGTINVQGSCSGVQLCAQHTHVDQ